MLVFASLCPHPPIIVPEIGKSEAEHTEKTRLALNALSQKFTEAQPEKVLIISPHTLLLHNRIALSHASELSGDLSAFNAPEIALTFNGEKELSQQIALEAAAQSINIELLQEENEVYPLSHGEIVPLYFLTKNHDNFDLIVSGFTDFSLEKHFEYGKLIGKIIQKSSHKIAVIASGDLSHRLKPGAPAGFSPFGDEFDQEIIELIQQKKIQSILKLDQHLINEAGECGLRSIVILMGILESTFYKPDVLAYEGPFGVGYATVNFKV